MQRTVSLLAVVLVLLHPSAVRADDAPRKSLSIQAMIAAAAEGTILVDSGIYEGSGNYNIDFGGKDIVLLAPAGPDSTIILVNGSAAEPRRGFIFQTGDRVPGSPQLGAC